MSVESRLGKTLFFSDPIPSYSWDGQKNFRRDVPSRLGVNAKIFRLAHPILGFSWRNETEFPNYARSTNTSIFEVQLSFEVSFESVDLDYRLLSCIIRRNYLDECENISGKLQTTQYHLMCVASDFSVTFST